jgi:hypothetical protein
MSLLIVYVALVIAGDLVAYLLGLVIERHTQAGRSAQVIPVN